MRPFRLVYLPPTLDWLHVHFGEFLPLVEQWLCDLKTVVWEVVHLAATARTHLKVEGVILISPKF